MTTLLLDILTTAVPATENQDSTTMTLAPATENQDSTTMTTLATAENMYHKMLCNDIEEKYAQCLNGDCLAVPAGDHVETFCHCSIGWVGTRCEISFIDLTTLNICSGKEMLSTPLGIAIIMLLSCIMLAIAAMACVIFRKKNKVCGKQQNVHNKPLLQQISYSNYHGVRVINTDLPTIDASKSSIIFEGTMQSPFEQHNLFSTFVNGGSDVVSDSACAKPDAVLIKQNNNTNNNSKQDLVKWDNQLSNVTLAS